MAKFNLVPLISVAMAGVATAYFPTCNPLDSGSWGTQDAAEALRDQLAARLDEVYNYTSAAPTVLAQITLHGITTYVSAQGDGEDLFDSYGRAAIQVTTILDNCDFLPCGTAEADGASVCYIEGSKAVNDLSPIIRVYGDN